MRLEGVNQDGLPEDIQAAFQGQEKKWGRRLDNHRIYARCPDVFRAVQGMSKGLRASGLIDEGLTALLNRRIALINGCEL